MVRQGAGMFAQADHHHLHEPALDGAVVAGMRLDARDDANVIGFGSILIEDDGEAFAGRAE